MSYYKQGTREKLRFSTKKGELSIENLWDLGLETLNDIAVDLYNQYESSGKKSFLVNRSEKDKIIKLKLDVILDILNTKKEEAEQRRTEKERKEHNQKIDELIERKKQGELEGKTVEELEQMRMK